MSSAKSFIEKKDPRAAVIQLKTLLQKEPDNPEARALLGHSLLLSGDPVAAAVELTKALALGRPKADVLPTLAEAMFRSGNFKELTATYAAADLAAPEAMASLKSWIAGAYLAQGDLSNAQAQVDAALRAVPDQPRAVAVQAQLNGRNGKFDDALKQVDRALAALADDAEIWVLKGDILLYGRSDSSAAMSAYRKAIALKPQDLVARMRAFSVLVGQRDLEGTREQVADMRKVLPNHPQTRYFEAQLAYMKGDYLQARTLVQQLLKVGGDNPALLQLDGNLELVSGSLMRAEIRFSKVLQLTPNSAAARRALAQTYLRMGASDKALATLQPLLATSDPASGAIAAQVYVQLGDWVRAEEYFARAVKSNPADIRSRTALAMSQLTRQGKDAPLTDLEAIAEADAGTLADQAMVSMLVGRREYDKAVQTIERIEKKQPGTSMFADLEGRVHLLRQDAAAARRSFERAVSIDPTFVASVKSLAELDVADKRPDLAKKRFEAVLEKDSKNMPAMFALAGLADRAGARQDEVTAIVEKAARLNPTEAAPRVLLVERLLAQQKFKQALDVAQEAAAAFPATAEVVESLGRAQAAGGQENQAVASYAKYASLRPGSALPYLRTADVFVATNNFDAARSQLRKALDITPTLVEAQTRLLAIEIQARRYPEALAVARQVQKQRPKEAIGYRLEGDVESMRRNFAAAEVAFRTALDKEPSGTIAANLHAAMLSGSKAPAAATLASRWMKEHPEDSNFRHYIGAMSSSRGDLVAAEEQYQSLVKSRPDDVVALNNLATVLLQQKKPGARAFAQRAVDLKPDVPALLDTLASALAAEKSYGQAIEAQQKAIAMAPGANSLRLNLARIQLDAGNKAEARRELERLLNLGNNFPAHAEVRQLMNRL